MRDIVFNENFNSFITKKVVMMEAGRVMALISVLLQSFKNMNMTNMAKTLPKKIV
jgi:hypothetical protein